MAVTRVRSRWTGGNLEFVTLDGNVILSINGVDRKLVIPTGSAIEVSGDSYVVTEPDDVTLEVDEGSGNLQVKDGGIDEDKLAASVAGDGLTGGEGQPLAVDVDDETIEVDGGTGKLKVKGGASGTFTTADEPALTVTITNGIITSITGGG